MVSGPFLCFNEIKFEDVPEAGTPEFNAFIEEVQKEGNALLEGTEDEKKHADWDVSKSQENGTVACKTRKARKNLDNGLKWHCRTGYFDAPAYEVFEQYLLMERLEEIKNYMSSMRDLSLLKTWGDNREATAFYTTVALPIGADREFAGLAVNIKHEGQKRFTIYTVPLKTEETSGGVKGLYSAVEDVREVERNGKTVVQWRKIAISAPRGSIPQFMSEGKVEPTISKDITDFVSYLKGKDITTSVISV